MPAPGRSPLPDFVELPVRLAAFALTSLGICGTPLLLAGQFRPLPVALLGIAGVIALELLWRRLRPADRPAPSRGHVVVGLLALAIAVVAVGVNVYWSAQHLLVDGDPGAYAVTGQLIADTGRLDVPTHDRDVFGGVASLNYAGAGFDVSPDKRVVHASFMHLLPESLAVASWIGGPRALLAADPLLGGFALLAVFVFACRLVRPLWALAAMLALGWSLPEVHFSRDAFSEIPSQLLVFAGLLLLYDVTRDRDRLRRPLPTGVVAGLVIGASCIARIDAFFYLVPLTAFVAVLALAGSRRLAAGIAAGAAVPAVIGYLDLTVGSTRYLELQSANLHLIGAALAATVVLAVVAVLVPRPTLRLWDRISGWRLGTGVAVVIGLLAVYAAALRPHLESPHNLPPNQPTAVQSLQKLEGLAVDPGRSYDELSLHWLSWYLGPFTVALGILAFALLVRRLLAGRRDPALLAALPFLLVFGASTLLYLWRPSIIPVQYWAMRRFLPTTIPGLLVLAVWIGSSWRPAGRRARTAVGCVVAAAVLVPPAVFLPPHIPEADYTPMLAATQQICAALHPDDAVVILGGERLATGMPQTVRAFCRVPTAVIDTSTTNAQLQQVQAAVKRSGRHLVYLAPVPGPFRSDGAVAAGQFRQVVDLAPQVVALSLSHRPRNRFTFPFTVWLARPAGS